MKKKFNKKTELLLRLIWILSTLITVLGILLLCFASDGFTGLVLLSITFFFWSYYVYNSIT